jgi:hypothetical protein
VKRNAVAAVIVLRVVAVTKTVRAEIILNPMTTTAKVRAPEAEVILTMVGGGNGQLRRWYPEFDQWPAGRPLHER